MKDYILEVCVDSVESALNASRGGANRLELCGNLIIGGTTPSPWLMKEIQKHTSVKINVLIRPRFGDFYYSDYEFNIMKKEIEMFGRLGANGVVIGMLKPDGRLDMERMRELILAAGDMSITMHRAFDVCVDPFEALEQAKELGISTILTSGQASDCLSGKELLKELVSKSKGEVDILLAGGVNAQVIETMRPYTQATSYHMSGNVIIDSEMTYRKEGVYMGLDFLSEYEVYRTDEQKIRDAKEVLDKIM